MHILFVISCLVSSIIGYFLIGVGMVSLWDWYNRSLDQPSAGFDMFSVVFWPVSLILFIAVVGGTSVEKICKDLYYSLGGRPDTR